jgi:hypothetical protein
MFLGLAANWLSWGSTYLQKISNASTSDVGLLFTARAIGYISGCTFSGYAFDLLKEKGKKKSFLRTWYKFSGHKLIVLGTLIMSSGNDNNV